MMQAQAQTSALNAWLATSVPYLAGNVTIKVQRGALMTVRIEGSEGGSGKVTIDLDGTVRSATTGDVIA